MDKGSYTLALQKELNFSTWLPRVRLCFPVRSGADRTEQKCNHALRTHCTLRIMILSIYWFQFLTVRTVCFFALYRFDFRSTHAHPPTHTHTHTFEGSSSAPWRKHFTCLLAPFCTRFPADVIQGRMACVATFL